MKELNEIHGISGTYLIKVKNIPIYIGQANDIADRFYSPKFSHVTKMNEAIKELNEKHIHVRMLKVSYWKYVIMYTNWNDLTIEKIGEKSEEAALIKKYRPIFNCDVRKIDETHVERFNKLTRLTDVDFNKLQIGQLTDNEVKELQDRLQDIRVITINR